MTLLQSPSEPSWSRLCPPSSGKGHWYAQESPFTAPHTAAEDTDTSPGLAQPWNRLPAVTCQGPQLNLALSSSWAAPTTSHHHHNHRTPQEALHTLPTAHLGPCSCPVWMCSSHRDPGCLTGGNRETLLKMHYSCVLPAASVTSNLPGSSTAFCSDIHTIHL